MKKNGFSLIELMVTISVLLIVTGVALPSFNNLRLSIQAEATMFDWVQFLNAARASAVSEESTITVCPFVNDTCVADFSQPWSMFTDNNKNKQLDSDEKLLKVLTLSKQQTLKLYPGNRNFIRFYNEPSGVYSGLMSSLTLCPTGKADKYASHLRINIMGRVSTLQTRNIKGVPMRYNQGTLEDVIC